MIECCLPFLLRILQHTPTLRWATEFHISLQGLTLVSGVSVGGDHLDLIYCGLQSSQWDRNQVHHDFDAMGMLHDLLNYLLSSSMFVDTEKGKIHVLLIWNFGRTNFTHPIWVLSRLNWKYLWFNTLCVVGPAQEPCLSLMSLNMPSEDNSTEQVEWEQSKVHWSYW